jgi:hypothetical protein
MPPCFPATLGSPRASPARGHREPGGLQGAVGQGGLGEVLAADEHPADEHLRECRPARPQLDGEALAPLREVAAVLEVRELDARLGEHPPHVPHVGVLRHADDHHCVLAHRLLHLADDGGVEALHVGEGGGGDRPLLEARALGGCG